MGLFDAVRKAFDPRSRMAASGQGNQEAAQEQTKYRPLVVPEVTPAEVLAEQSSSAGPLLLLDIREPYERAQALSPNSKHIPMNSLPQRLAEIDRRQDIVVYCAHGNRSYGVAGWLNQQGYTARSLKGGIADWERKHGPVEIGYSGKS